MKHDIDVAVAYSAPLLLRGQRGHSRLPAIVSQSLPGRIRYVDPRDMAERRFEMLRGSDRGLIREMGGRLWRPVGSSQGDRVPLRIVIDTLSGAGQMDLRITLSDLSLHPWNVADHRGRLAPHARTFADGTVPEGRLALDLRADARAAVAGRVSDALVHDGERIWIAMPPPLLHPGRTGTAWVGRAWDTSHVDMAVGCLPHEADRYVAHLHRLGSRGALSDTQAYLFRADCESLAMDLGNIAVDPLAGIARFVRRHSAILPLAAASYPGRAAEGKRSLRDAIANLAPTVARGSADLINRRDLLAAVEGMASLAVGMLECGQPPDSRGAFLAQRVLAYVEEIARPTLVAEPAEEDAADIGSLAP